MSNDFPATVPDHFHDRERLRELLREGAASSPTSPVDVHYFNELRERVARAERPKS